MLVSCSFPLWFLRPPAVGARRYAAGAVNDVSALCSLLGAICCVLAAVCHHANRKTSTWLVCVCVWDLKLMSHCSEGVCVCVCVCERESVWFSTFQLLCILKTMNLLPTLPAKQHPDNFIGVGVCVCVHLFSVMRFLLCVTVQLL